MQRNWFLTIVCTIGWNWLQIYHDLQFLFMLRSSPIWLRYWHNHWNNRPLSASYSSECSGSILMWDNITQISEWWVCCHPELHQPMIKIYFPHFSYSSCRRHLLIKFSLPFMYFHNNYSNNCLTKSIQSLQNLNACYQFFLSYSKLKTKAIKPRISMFPKHIKHMKEIENSWSL